MSIIVKLKPKTYITAYHCMACGAPCDKDTLVCKYCRTRYGEDAIESIQFSQGKSMRLMADCGNNFVYFPLSSLDEKVIEVGGTSYHDAYGMLHRVAGIEQIKLDVGFHVNDIVMKKLYARIKTGAVKMRIETGWSDQAYDFDGYFDELHSEYVVGCVPNHEMTIMPYGRVNKKRLDDPPVDTRCPNCGAPITSRLGCCDYCTGWVEYVNGI